MDVPKFDTLDIPSDIQLSLHDTNNYYIFHDLNNNTYFRIIIQANTIKRVSCNHDGTLIHNSIVYDDIIGDLNDYIWKLSTEKYILRYNKLEIIERIRNIDDNQQIKKLLDFLKNNFNTNNRENNID
jgi:hypothetical protein